MPATAPITYPAVVAGPLYGFDDWTGSAFPICYPYLPFGPYFHAGKLFVVLVYSSTQPGFNPTFTTVFQSSDNGLTWEERDIGNRIAMSSGIPIIAPTASGSILFVGNSSPLVIDQFNMFSGVWGPRVATAGPISTDVAAMPQSAGYRKAFLGYRSDGSFVVLYLTDVAGAAKAFYAIWDGVSWTLDLPITSNDATIMDIPAGLVIGADDRTHMFFTSGSSSIAGFPIVYHIALESNNTLGTYAAVDPDGYTLATFVDVPHGVFMVTNVSPPVNIGGTIFLPYYRRNTATGNDEVAVVNAPSAASPAWVVEAPEGFASLPSMVDYAPLSDVPYNNMNIVPAARAIGIIYTSGPVDGNQTREIFYLEYPADPVIADQNPTWLVTRAGQFTNDCAFQNIIVAPRISTWQQPTEVYAPHAMGGVWAQGICTCGCPPTPPPVPGSGRARYAGVGVT